MSDPNAWPQFPGFPQQSSAHATPSRAPNVTSGGKVNSLFPAISRADQDRGVGSINRSAFGPPAGGWPVGAPDLSPLKQRLIAGMGDLAQQVGGIADGVLGIALGGILGLMSQKIAQAPEETVAKGLTQFEQMVAYWRTGEGGPQDGGTPPAAGAPGGE